MSVRNRGGTTAPLADTKLIVIVSMVAAAASSDATTECHLRLTASAGIRYPMSQSSSIDTSGLLQTMPPRLGNLFGISTIRPRTARSCGIVELRYSRSPAPAARTCRSKARHELRLGRRGRLLLHTHQQRLARVRGEEPRRTRAARRSTRSPHRRIGDGCAACRPVRRGSARPGTGTPALSCCVTVQFSALHPQRGHEVDDRCPTTEACSRVMGAGDGDARSAARRRPARAIQRVRSIGDSSAPATTGRVSIAAEASAAAPRTVRRVTDPVTCQLHATRSVVSVAAAVARIRARSPHPPAHRAAACWPDRCRTTGSPRRRPRTHPSGVGSAGAAGTSSMILLLPRVGDIVPEPPAPIGPVERGLAVLGSASTDTSPNSVIRTGAALATTSAAATGSTVRMHRPQDAAVVDRRRRRRQRDGLMTGQQLHGGCTRCHARMLAEPTATHVAIPSIANSVCLALQCLIDKLRCTHAMNHQGNQ